MDGDLNLSESNVERLPPQSIEAEQAILGAILVNPDVIGRICDQLQPDQFYRKAHQVIFAAVLDLFEKSEPIDIVTLSQYLKDQGKLDNVGGRQYLTDLALSIATTANAEYYAKTVAEKSILRNLIKAGTEIVASCYEDTDTDIVVDKAEQLIFNIAQGRNTSALVPIKDIVNESFARIEARYEQRDALSGLSTGFYDLDEMTSGWQRSDLVIIAARPSMGKCLAYDAEIMLADGTIATIEELYKRGGGQMLTLDSRYKLGWTTPSLLIDDGIKPVYKVVTKLGRTIETTLSHPFLTIDGWQPLAALNVGSRVAVPRKLPVNAIGEARECEMKLLGYLLGDGNVTGNCPRFTNSNERVRGDFEAAVQEFGRVTVSVDERSNRTTSLRVRKDSATQAQLRTKLLSKLRNFVDSTQTKQKDLASSIGASEATVSLWMNGKTHPNVANLQKLSKSLNSEEFTSDACGTAPNALQHWLGRIGLIGKSAIAKDIPSFVFGLNNECIALLLNRLFTCDGWASVFKSGQAQIGFSSVSNRLAGQVQHLLLRFGIIAKLKRRTVAYKGERRECWQVEITDQLSLKTFIEKIGIYGKEEAVAFVAASLLNRRHQTNADLVPVEVWNKLSSAKQELSWAQVARTAGIAGSSNMHVGKRALSRGRLYQLASTVGSEELLDLSESDVYWDQVVSITYAGDKQVYDLTIPETHNFVANDICVHNTALVLNLAQHAAVECKAPCAVFSLEMSKEQLVQRLLCAEARIDANKMRTGFLQSSDWQNLATAMGRLGEAPLYIDDSAAVSVMDVRAKARRLKAEMKSIGLIIIDYIQLMQGRARSDGNRVQEVSEISRGLKQLARELNCPVLALSQLSRAVEARQNKRPMLSDLRESGCLTGDSLVFMADTGNYERIDSLVGRTGFHVMAVDPATWQLVPRLVTNAFSTGVKQVFKMVTRTNRVIRATANHKFLTVDGWKRLDELAVGTHLATPKQGRSQSEKATSRSAASTAVLAEPSTTKLTTGDISWDEIVDISPDGVEEVYDLTVQGLHNFVCNDIVVHNSIEQDADIVMFIYRDDYYNQESEKRGEAEIIIAKQRNGPVGTVELLYQASITRFLNKATNNQYVQV